MRRLNMLVAGGAALIHAVIAGPLPAQTVIFEDTFEDGVDGQKWHVQVPDNQTGSVSVDGGNLHITNSASDTAGIISNPTGFPLIERPTDDTEYDVYFHGVRLPEQAQQMALGLYSVHGADKTPRLPEGIHDSERLGYGFAVGVSREAPNAHWVSTTKVNAGGAASDGQGYEGFAVWNYGKVYDFRMQVTKDDINWWGRVQPENNWRLICDPDMNLIGHDGQEPGGRSRFGVFISAEGQTSDASATPGQTSVTVDRVTVTRYKPKAVKTLLKERFDSGVLARSVWSPVMTDDSDLVEVAEDRPLVIRNAGGGSGWDNAAGIMTSPVRFPLFVRPKDASTRVYVDFLGITLPTKKQRAALGLYSVKPGSGQEPKFPDGYGPDGGLAYYFWLIPDNDRLVENSNQIRSAVIADRYPATDNWHHTWIWSYTEKRDLRLKVTADDVQWYVRKDAQTGWRVLRDNKEFFYRRPILPEDRAVGYWRVLYDPGTPAHIAFDGSETNGRNEFGVFVHVSSAGEEGSITWEDGELSIEGIEVTVVKHDDATDG